jgi:hypothetical protein
MDGCDARHNEGVLLCIIDRFVMAITAAEVVDRHAILRQNMSKDSEQDFEGADESDTGPPLGAAEPHREPHGRDCRPGCP